MIVDSSLDDRLACRFQANVASHAVELAACWGFSSQALEMLS